MATDHRAALRDITTFTQLVRYLRDEMNWPIAVDDFQEVDDLFFEYTADELGIDTKNAAKIRTIKRLRPLTPMQPWGIFFVEFEPRKLPVVALRRILGQVVTKKRASAKDAERVAWSTGDLLFISNYGDGAERQITFAHFTQPEEKHDLPTLKVLGWDNLDTPLHLDKVAKELTEHLSWPVDHRDVNGWRKQWRSAFTVGHGEVITTSKQLSTALARLARAIRDRIRTALAIETNKGHLTKLMIAFREALIHDLRDEEFADMYAQTIAYGLLSARITDPTSKTADDFARHMRTNPFLKELMETFLYIGGRRGGQGDAAIDFDELGVNDVVELLDEAKMDRVVADFGDRNPDDDPVIHFYEDFLKVYDPTEKKKRGVFYTPRPVVSYIVRSVDELLRTEFNLEDGLADVTSWGEMAKLHHGLTVPDGVSPDEAFVQVLDPATGTGTFLVEVIDVIHRTLLDKWKRQGYGTQKIAALWNEYVPEFLLPRLHGYELLMAPYAIAHLKIGLKLHETGYRFATDERARVFLTNALELPTDTQFRLSAMPALAHEAQAVNQNKRRQRFTVVVGNPPYSGVSANTGPSAAGDIEAYKYIEGVHFRERKHWLHDDYVKFLRLGETTITLAGYGICGLITNHAFYDNPTFRGVRWNLLRSFNDIRLLDLHGNTMRREASPNGETDGNVFDIQQGVAISILMRAPDATSRRITFGEIWGTGDEKCAVLAASSQASLASLSLSPKPNFFFFVPSTSDTADEFEQWPKLSEVFQVFSAGFITARDHFVIDFDEDVLTERLKEFADVGVSDDEIRARYFAGMGSSKYPNGDTRGWKLPDARATIRKDVMWRERVARCLYRPFDERWIYWTESMIDWPRPEVSSHLLKTGNVGLVFMRQVASGDGYSHFLISRLPVDNRACYSNKGIMTLAPLYLYDTADSRVLSERQVARANFTLAFLASLRQALHLPPHAAVDADGVLNYIYAVCHSATYRTRYAESLRFDFPRLPLPASQRLYDELGQLGKQLVEVHLLESETVESSESHYSGPKCPVVSRVGWADRVVWLDAAATSKGVATKIGTCGFRGVSREVWEFQIGGYQVCHKWLKDRNGRVLSDADVAHYLRIVAAISETMRLMKEIDGIIERHGGWPAAFRGGELKNRTDEAFLSPLESNATSTERFVTCLPLVPLRAAASAFSDPQRVEEDGRWEWVTVATKRRLDRGMFVAQVVGKSMEPAIPDGSWCLFRSPVTGTREGKTVLVQLRDAIDPETGERYTVKRYHSEKIRVGNSWRHAKITLKPSNPAFEAMELLDSDEGELCVVAEMLEVLTTPPVASDHGAAAPTM